ncbi:MAG: ATP-dependent helicase [Microbacteriaceae bacterium]|nr:ATP-dependent helicase [Microbacteriaceae bacterium]
MAITGFSAPAPSDLSFEMPDADQRQLLDLDAQRSAVVVGAPGTGKTSLAVELVATRVERDGWSPDDIIVLTPNRRAANRLRDAISQRLSHIAAGVDSVHASVGPRARTPMSLAFAIAAQHAMVSNAAPARLLTGAEQDTILRDVLEGEIADHTGAWPEELHADIRTRGVFRTELRELIGRAHEHGLTPEDLRERGVARGIAAWEAAGTFWRTYRDIVAVARPDHFDASELLSLAAAALAEPDVLPQVKLVILDDAQEATAGVIGLLRGFASRGVPIILLGDPDIATTTFRGAIPEFLGRAATELGVTPDSVSTIVLRTVHRHGPAIRGLVSAFTTMGSALAAGQRSAASVAPAGAESVAPAGAESLDDSVAVSDGGEQSRARDAVLTVCRDTRTREVGAIARILREQHLLQGVAWNEMAVVVRNSALVATYARALAHVDVPSRTLLSETSLQAHAVTRDMMTVLKMALGRVVIDRESAADILVSPFGGLSALELRRLRLAFRHDRLAEGEHVTGGEVIPEALRNPALFDQFDFAPARRAARFAHTLALVKSQADQGSTIEELLWTVWSRSGLATQWREDALSSGFASDEANRNLDAVIALFTSARRFVERTPDAPADQFITEFDRSDVPEDTLARQADVNSVLVTTPSGVIGSQFDVVVVAGVQENVWPNLRPRGTLLFPQQLVRDIRGQQTDTVDARREVSDDELRMFAMATSRARHVLVISAHENDEDLPSNYFARAATRATNVPANDDGLDHRLSLRGLVGRLRAELSLAPTQSHDAASALARLAGEGVPGADPNSWLGMRAWSTTLPLVDFDSNDVHERVRLSPSKLESWEKDQLVWFIDSVVTGDKTTASGLGTLLHSAMEEVAPSGAVTGPVSSQDVMNVVTRRWSELATSFEAPWQSDVELGRARVLADAIAQYLTDFDASGARLLRSEGGFTIELDEDGENPVRVTVSGKIDRIEENPDGSILIADLKTGKSNVAVKDIPDHGQLTCYQLAIHVGPVDGVAAGSVAGGAKLIFVADPTAKRLYTERVQAAGTAEFFDAARERIRTAARGMAGYTFLGRLFESEERGEFASRYEYRIHLAKAVTA